MKLATGLWYGLLGFSAITDTSACITASSSSGSSVTVVQSSFGTVVQTGTSLYTPSTSKSTSTVTSKVSSASSRTTSTSSTSCYLWGWLVHLILWELYSDQSTAYLVQAPAAIQPQRASYTIFAKPLAWAHERSHLPLPPIHLRSHKLSHATGNSQKETTMNYLKTSKNDGRE
jgi:hypothetical protein